MKVSDVLKRKNTDGVASVKDSDSLAELVRQLKERKFGAMMVLDSSGTLAGVISERDVVRALGTDGPASLNNAVSAYMTKAVKSTAPDEDVMSVLERMTEGRFRHMPVLESGKLVGVVSIGDVVAARLAQLARENEALEEFIKG
ncbi:MAG: CBS domain-containing protein [Neomegalonema sp.]|nr:CBS domain-containing protein [Neomegalonema sp.]